MISFVLHYKIRIEVLFKNFAPNLKKKNQI